MRRNLLVFSGFILLMIACSSSVDKRAQAEQAPGWVVVLSGTVKYPQSGEIFIQETRTKWSDTIRLKGNKFSKRITVSEPGYYKVNFFNRQVIDVILYKNNLDITVDGNSPQGFFQVTGSPEIELIKKAQGILTSMESNPRMAGINSEYVAAANAGNEAKMDELRSEYSKLLASYQLQVSQLIEQSPVSLGSIHLLSNNPVLSSDDFFNTYQNVADRAARELPESSYARDFVAMVTKLKRLAIGQPAPEIALPDTTGRVVALSSLRGKYVLVDFWAKWCGPCRQENPNVVKAFNKYKSKGFTVFGVSLDRTKEDWLKAIHEDKLSWTHVSDLKFWNSEAAKAYNVTGIPFSVLVDPSGRIIAKNLRGANLDRKLAELLP